MACVCPQPTKKQEDDNSEEQAEKVGSTSVENDLPSLRPWPPFLEKSNRTVNPSTGLAPPGQSLPLVMCLFPLLWEREGGVEN